MWARQFIQLKLFLISFSIRSRKLKRNSLKLKIKKDLKEGKMNKWIILLLEMKIRYRAPKTHGELARF